MKILKIKNRKNTLLALKLAEEVFKKGGAVIFPTDTVYGLGSNALDEKAVKRIFEIKNRPRSKPLPVFISSLEMAKKLAFIDKRTEKILKKIWPGKVTAVLFSKGVVPSLVTAGLDKIGLRIPEYELLRLLMQRINFPIIATSANISAKPASGKISEIISQFKQVKARPDLVLDIGDLPPSKPSTVMDLTKTPPEILRQGDVIKEQFFEILQPTNLK